MSAMHQQILTGRRARFGQNMVSTPITASPYISPMGNNLAPSALWMLPKPNIRRNFSSGCRVFVTWLNPI